MVAVGSAPPATNPLGTGAITIDGGTLSLDTRNGNVTFDNAVTVATSGTIEAQPDAVTLSLGSAATTNVLTINSGQTLTVNTFGGTPTGLGNLAGATLQINEGITGAGAHPGQHAGRRQYQPRPGTLVLNPVATSNGGNQNNFTGTLTVNGGTVIDQAANGLGAGAVVVNNGGQVTINGSGTATTSPASPSTPAARCSSMTRPPTPTTASAAAPALNLAGGTFTLNGTTPPHDHVGADRGHQRPGRVLHRQPEQGHRRQPDPHRRQPAARPATARSSTSPAPSRAAVPATS